MKQCGNCYQFKDESNFYFRKDRNSYYSVCKECRKLYLKENKGSIKNRCHIYYLNHIEEIKERVIDYTKNKLRKNNIYRLEMNLRHRIYLALKGNTKLEPTMKLVGCNPEQLKNYLESKFKLGMSWDNYGKWHVDHIKPCAKFDLSKSEQQRDCFHYSNLQPLWAIDNLTKSINNF